MTNMNNHTIHVVFTGGGTGGHLFPGLAVAERMAEVIPRVRITFCGSGKPFEQKYVSQAGFDFLALPSRPLPRGARDWMTFVFENMAGYWSAQRFLRDEKVTVVVGTGGYASVPMARAAARNRVPLVLLEQNVIPGKATRWLSKRAALVCTSFDQTGERLPSQCPVRLTGNPVRRIDGARRTKMANRLLVLGGSGGARSLNENVPRALFKIRGQLEGWEIVHQSGEAELDTTRTLYEKLQLKATVKPFLADMPSALAEASLAVCRAGGTTLAELAVAGVPSLLLPYPHAADDHQAANAKHYADGGGCVTIDERDVSDRLDEQIGDQLFFLLANEKMRQRMAAAMREMARPQAADDVAELVWSIVSSQALQSAMVGV